MALQRTPPARRAPQDAGITAGISGMAIDLPPYRVSLEDWCGWTGASWDKISAVVGHAFRVPGPAQSVYTMAANAALKLLLQNDVDPARIGLLALGTESSNDNSAGSIIIKGMLDQALDEHGLPRLSQHCEVPEIKHACLGGVYALKNAVRHCLLEDSAAIVICSDLALYARGSSGEPTQGAGAVALLVERNPALASLELGHAGRASDYRISDFRKPLMDADRRPRSNLHYPVFNGRFSTYCYLDQVRNALSHLYQRRRVSPAEWLQQLRAVFFHRPYRRMPQSAFALVRLCAEALSHGNRSGLLQRLCPESGSALDEALGEMRGRHDLPEHDADGPSAWNPFTRTNELMKGLRAMPEFEELVLHPLRWGDDSMMQLGNIYSGALFAWLAAGLEEAARAGENWAGDEILLIGYGSGDAAEALPMRVCEGWREAAGRIHFNKALEPAYDLDRSQYEALHAGLAVDDLPKPPGFRVESIGTKTGQDFQDEGIEYYAYSA